MVSPSVQILLLARRSSCLSVLVLWTLGFIQVLPSVLLRRLLTPCASLQHRFFAPSTRCRRCARQLCCHVGHGLRLRFAPVGFFDFQVPLVNPHRTMVHGFGLLDLALGPNGSRRQHRRLPWLSVSNCWLRILGFWDLRILTPSWGSKISLICLF